MITHQGSINTVRKCYTTHPVHRIHANPVYAYESLYKILDGVSV